MVHLRYNEKESNPNPHINYIAPLPADNEQQDEARQLLRALAAQVRPIMKRHGFSVNSFEEYEYNEVFAGRNWNNGETVEIVLRRADGSFYPTYWLMSTLCHELAHIKHMNHGPAFRALWSRLRAEVRQLQDRGYYGDGFWSSGTRLRDLATVGGDGIETGDLPEYMCGGAQSRTRPTATRRRRSGAHGKRREVVPSLHTGAQTTKKRKAGGRITSKYAFTGEGSKLADDTALGAGFGKRANSKRARDERALAIERRLMSLQGNSQEIKPKKEESNSEHDASDDEFEFVHETNAERRQALLESEKDDKNLVKVNARDSWKHFKDAFNFQGPSDSKLWKFKTEDDDSVLELFDSDDEAVGHACDVPVPSGSTFVSGNPLTNSSANPSKGKAKASTKVPESSGRFVQTEIDFRKNATSGSTPMNGHSGQTLGGSTSSRTKSDPPTSSRPNLSSGAGPTGSSSSTSGKAKAERDRGARDQITMQPSSTAALPTTTAMGAWSCLVCTL